MSIRELVKRASVRDLSDPSALYDYFELVRLLEEVDFKESHRLNKDVRRLSAKYAKERGSPELLDLNRRALLFDAPHDFDAAIRYAEWNREPKKAFYMPRRKQLFPIVQAMQRLEERKIRILGVMAPPGIGKTTIELMFLVWSGMKRPDLSSLMGSHSNSFLRGAYDEIGRMLDPKGDYLWCDIFPGVTVCKTNAQDMRIDLGERKRFETFEFSSIGSGNAGKVRASNLLVADDLVPDIESALSRERMDKLWQQYYTDLMQRMIGDCVQLLVQTPWTIHDPIDRLEQEHIENPEAEFIHLPALDENDESNFDYPYGVGFSTEFYHNQRKVMDDASWRALYMTEPIEREGLLFPEEELHRYFELPVDRDPDAVIAVCDTAEGGGDSVMLPIAYIYGEDVFIEDVVFDNSTPEHTKPQCAKKLVEHKVSVATFESNSAGSYYARDVEDLVKKSGGRISIRTKRTISNKQTRIENASDGILKHFYFKDKALYEPNSQYGRMIREMVTYTRTGKVKHDDAPDGMSLLENEIRSLMGYKIEVFGRPF